MQNNDISTKIATTTPQTLEEKSHFSLNGDLKANISSASNFVQIIWAALEVTALSLLIEKGLSYMPHYPWLSSVLAVAALYFFHKLLKSSLGNYLVKYHLLQKRKDKATDFGLTNAGYPILPFVIGFFMFALSVYGTQNLIETYAYKATEKSADTKSVDDMLDMTSNNKSATAIDIERSYEAKEKEAIQSIKRDMNKLENELQKLSRVRTSSASTKVTEERNWINRQLRQKENELDNIKAQFRIKKQNEIAASNLKYTTLLDSLTLQKNKILGNTENVNLEEREKEKSAKSKGFPIGLLCSTLLMLVFVIAQYHLKYHDVMSGIFEIHHYGTLQQHGSMFGIWKKVIVALVYEHSIQKALDLYNRLTISKISLLNTSFEVVDNNLLNDVQQTATPVITTQQSVENQQIDQNSTEALMMLPRYSADISNFKTGHGNRETVLRRLVEMTNRLEVLKKEGLHAQALERVNKAIERKDKEVIV